MHMTRDFHRTASPADEPPELSGGSNLSGHPIHRAEDLTAEGNLAGIVLGGQVYTLRITRAGKLILTK